MYFLAKPLRRKVNKGSLLVLSPMAKAITYVTENNPEKD